MVDVKHSVGPRIFVRSVAVAEIATGRRICGEKGVPDSTIPFEHDMGSLNTVTFFKASFDQLLEHCLGKAQIQVCDRAFIEVCQAQDFLFAVGFLLTANRSKVDEHVPGIVGIQ